MKTSLKKRLGSLALAIIWVFSLVGAAFAASGDLDPTFGGDGKVTTAFPLAGWVTTNIQGYDKTVAAVQQPDGKVIVVSDDRSASFNYAAFGLARYTADGSLDTTFDTDGKVSEQFGIYYGAVPTAAALLSDGRIVVVGKAETNSIDDTDDVLMALFKSDGSLDTTFSSNGFERFVDPAGNETATAVTVQANDQIVMSIYSDHGSPNSFVLERFGTDGTLDTTFDSDGIASTACGGTIGLCVIKDLAIQTVGGVSKIVALGSAMSTDDPGDFILMRYNLDGSLDTSFGTSGITTTNFGAASNADDANAFTIQADGKIIAVGSASNGTNNDFALARYTADGVLDTSFGSGGKVVSDFGGDDEINGIALQSDGSVLATGYTGGTMKLVRYTSAGALDSNFIVNGLSDYWNSVGVSVLIQTGGRIVGAGYYGNATILLIGLNNDGSSDNSFGVEYADSDAGANAVAIQADGKIVAAGYSVVDKNTDANAFSLARYNADGSLDTSFGGDGRVVTSSIDAESTAYDVAIQTDGKIVAAGYCRDGAGTYKHIALVRYNSDGSLDTSFGTNGIVNASVGKTVADVYDMALQSDGKIVLAGSADDGGPRELMLTRYTTNGTLDTTFGTDGITFTPFSYDAVIRSIVLQSDGTILAAGSAYYYEDPNYSDFTVARYSADGALDATFGTDGAIVTDFGGEEYGRAIALQSDGKFVVGGYTYTGGTDFVLARYNADGSLDTSFDTDGLLTTDFNAGSDDKLFDLLIQPDGQIVAAGNTYSSATNDEDFALVKYNTDGSLDTTFNSTGKLAINFNTYDSEAAYALALQPDGQIVLSGKTAYETVSGQNAEFALARVENALATIPTTVTLASSVNPSAFGNSVTFTATISPTPDGGTVTFKDGTSAISGCIDLSIISGQATCDTSVLTVGSHVITTEYSGTSNYAAATNLLTPNQQVNQATPILTWANPADIAYGTALGAAQLNATADVPGTFTYTPAAGTYLSVGTHSLHVDFTPTDAANYSSTSKDVSLTVTQEAATVTWSNPADIVYGTALSTTQLNATASVPGTFTYTPASGTLLSTGTHTLHVDFTPTDTVNYANASKDVSIKIIQATPVITWADPADIAYGTALGASQLNATADVDGTFTYTPAAGIRLSVGTHSLHVDFTPTDTVNYANTSKDVSITILAGTIFTDVPSNYWAKDFIERLYFAGVTGGCSTNPLMYCPTVTVTRDQMAVFLLRGEHGSSYAPPPATGTMFADVPQDYWAAAWIEQLANEGITVGCGNGNYCPSTPVTRAQVAVFLLRGKHGGSYTPPAATGIMFADVPQDYWAAAWIEQLANEGITGGCGNGNYCPATPVTRDQMAVFLVRAFSLP